MRLLFISFYFPPDLCAGSFRAGALINELPGHLGKGDEIDVITTYPNRYASYFADAPDKEDNGLVRIRRIGVPLHRSGMLDQSIAYAKFALGTWREVGRRRYDLVIATTSRLMTGILGAVIARKMGAPLYLDIRDIFTDTMEDVLSGRLAGGMLPAFRWMERYALQYASRINLVSEGFYSYFEKIVERRKLVFFPNGIDEEFLLYDFRKMNSESIPIVLYAGNIGAGQGLHRIIPAAAKHLENECRFLIVGDGGMRQRLVEDLRKTGVKNVQLINPVSRTRLLQLYSQSDYLLLHLNDYKAFQRVLPSKIFEYAATGKPVLAGVDGYPRKFILENIEHAAVFNPCDVKGFVRALRDLSPDMVDRGKFVLKYRRKVIMHTLAEDIISIALKPGYIEKPL